MPLTLSDLANSCLCRFTQILTIDHPDMIHRGHEALGKLTLTSKRIFALCARGREGAYGVLWGGWEHFLGGKA